jgi:hypothetical protein
MPITFKSRHAPDIVMLETVARQLIRLTGHSGSVPSSLGVADVGPALERLRLALTSSAKAVSDADEERDSDRNVSLGHRALPLVQMLESAAMHCDYVIWDR